MAKKPQLDVRRLKDEVADYLKKSRFEKAAEVLEQLVSAEPKDMSHRLKLGDTYRRLNQPEQAIGAYQHAAKFFGDEGQLIKAIGAVKIVLEIDPRNGEAQRQLGEMNERRMGKATLEGAGLKKAAAAAMAAARATAPIELDDSPASAAPHSLVPDAPDGALDLGADDAPLELDDGMVTRPIRPVPAPAR